ncbi:MAG: class I SAM-dependent methyltransferase [Alphaproteobacteria bacterium]|nr:class I SAM-dependent methyltransferase [Alphaproteobacteria bacterium]
MTADLAVKERTRRHAGATRDYTHAAGLYGYRVNYASQVVRCLAAFVGAHRPGFRVADIGAGTGKLTAMLSDLGAAGVAVEPNAAMRAEGIRLTGEAARFEWRDGTGERTGLPEASVDWVCVGTAFHLFAIEEALREFRRILKPGGAVTAIWVLPDEDLCPLVQSVEATLEARHPGLDRLIRKVYATWPQMDRWLGPGAGFRERFYIDAWQAEPMSPERYLGIWRGQADVPLQITPQQWQDTLAALWELVKDRPEVAPIYRTRAWTARV